jgi:hypothetical protein
VALSIVPVAPWRVRLDPYPFAEEPASFRLVRRVLPKGDNGDADAFRHRFGATAPEYVQITAVSSSNSSETGAKARCQTS